LIVAHSPNDAGAWHGLEDHLRGTAALASRFAEPFGGAEVARWLGLLHDVGKSSCGWQDRLRQVASTGQPVGYDHKLLGARLARERGLGSFALAIAGHHGGLMSPEWLKDRWKCRTGAELQREAEAMATLDGLLPELAVGAQGAIPAEWRDRLVLEMAVRMCFSALCDADFLDTAAHFAGGTPPAVRPAADFQALRNQYEKARAALLGPRRPSLVGALREEVYQSCTLAAAARPGIFRLAAPTGSGKTISAGAFALHHAAAHGLRRVIVAVPYLTITEQNAQVYRELLEEPDSPGIVLEHHSGVNLDHSGRHWAKLAAENWDAPFIVTTTVRLFESLFGRRPAAMRRLHRLSGSVIVLDEVQALPHQMLVPILDALQVLVRHFGVTVLLASATQPDFWHLSPWRSLPATEIVSDPSALARQLRRVSFNWQLDPELSLAGLAAKAATHAQTMVVVNTTADARTVLEAWRGAMPTPTACHLSTRMCAAHRRRVLAKVRDRLRDGLPVLLVSTQLIEAGVDVDFPVVYRVMAPADSLLQAAGRCNREGSLPGEGQVIVVNPGDAGAPPAYRGLVATTKAHFGPDKADPDDIDALRDYYHSVYDNLNLESPASVGQRIQQARMLLDYAAVTDGPRDPATNKADRRYAFKMISDDGVALVTPQGADCLDQRQAIEALAERVRTAALPMAGDLRALQPFTTTIHPAAARPPGVRALMRPIFGEPGQPGSLSEWLGGYDDHTGIDLDPHAEEFVC
jgi:CRISPR-associated endonuclease/helicase Cas3